MGNTLSACASDTNETSESKRNMTTQDDKVAHLSEVLEQVEYLLVIGNVLTVLD